MTLAAERAGLPAPGCSAIRRPARKKAEKTHASPPSEAFSNSRRDIPCLVPHASREKHHFQLGYKKSGLVALLGQRILGLALGYEDVNDHDELRRDRALSTAMGRVECARSDCEPLAGKSTLNRMELSANGRDPAKARQITVDFDALDELLVELYLVWGERGQMPKRLVLDIDATDVELHGRQEHRFYHGYYHAYCYLPRLVFCNGCPVRTELRTSSSDVAAGVVETVAPLVDRLRKRFPQVPILIRADGAYCRDELMTWCEVRGAGRGLRAGTAAQ